MQHKSRKTLRKKEYDYSQEGAYFITICTEGRVHRFGTISKKAMVLNDLGRTIETRWKGIPEHFPGVSLGEFIIMPDHLHGILILNDISQAEVVKTAAIDVPQIIHWFKTRTTNEFFRYINARFPGEKSGLLWHRSYYDIIIRNREAFDGISIYIKNNPASWAKDKFHPTPP